MNEHNFNNGICSYCGYSEMEFIKYGYACDSPMIQQNKNVNNLSEFCPKGHGKMEPGREN